jgi:hypothetical protein
MFRLITSQYIFHCCKHPYFHDGQDYGGVSGKIRLGVEKTVCSGLWIQKHASFAPARQKMLGFRLRSPLLLGEEPCPLRLQTVFSSRSLRRVWVLILLGLSLRVFDAFNLINSTSYYHGFGDAPFFI